MVQIQHDKVMVELRPDLFQDAEVSTHRLIRGKQRESGHLTVYLQLWSANSCQGDKCSSSESSNSAGLVIVLSLLDSAMPEAFHCPARTRPFPLAFELS